MDSLARISFANCNFEKFYLLENVFESYHFQNCMFKHFNARKAKFSNCQFKDCKITNSGMTRAEFYDTNFKNSKFLDIDLVTSNLDLIFVEDVKIWKSKYWIEIKDFSSFEKHLDEMVRD